MVTTQELLNQVETAIQAVLGGAQQYTIGDYTCTRASLPTLMAYRRELLAELAREQAGHTGPRFIAAVRR